MNKDDVSRFFADFYELREILSWEGTDISNDAVNELVKKGEKISKMKKNLSTLASKISAILVDGDGNKLNSLEKNTLDQIKSFVVGLGNLQFKLNVIYKKLEQLEKEDVELADSGIELGESIFDLQDKARNITAIFRALGYEVPKSDLTPLMNTFREPQVATN